MARRPTFSPQRPPARPEPPGRRPHVVADAAFEHDQRFLRSFVDFATDVVLLHDELGRIVDANQAAIDVLGYRREELAGQWPGLYDPDWTEERSQAVCARLQNGEVVKFDARHRRKDGTMVPVEVQLRQFTEQDRTYSISVSRDITDRKRVEGALQIQARRFEEIARVAPGVLHSWRRHADGTSSLSYASPRMAELLGLSHEELSTFGADPAALTHPDDREHVMRAIGESERSLTPFHSEYRIAHPARGYIWIECHTAPVREPDGSVVWHGFLTDITERKRAEQALRESEARLAEAQEIGGFVSFELEVTTGELSTSATLNAILGVAVGRLPANYSPLVDETIHPDDRALVERELALAMVSHEPGEFTFRYRHPDGRERVLHVRRQTVSDDEGRPDKLVGTVQDVTERRVLDERLRQAQKMEAIGQLAGGVAHDFNNILTVINGYAAMGAEYLDPGDPQLEIFSEIMRAGSRASSLTRQLLTFSRKQIIKPQVVYLGTLVGDLASMLRRVIGDHVELVVTVAAGVSPVLVDAAQFQQVLLNLAVNARDAMPQGGRLSIDVRNVLLDERYCGAHPGVSPGNYVRMMVSDTGLGMDAATKARVFEPFFTTKEPGQGTGLGLSVVHGTVGQSGGHLDIRSEVGLGTSVLVYVPMADESASTSLGSLVRAAQPRGTETILIADDDDGVRLLAQRVLRNAGYRVLTARHGEDALRIERRQAGDVHLLVTDVVMPRMGGRELANQLSARRPGLSVLFMSGYAPETVEYHGVLEESENFLPKPFSPSDLARKVRDVLDRATAVATDDRAAAVPADRLRQRPPLRAVGAASANDRAVRRRRSPRGKPLA